ncbi:hypothetical protein B0H12DRAFT_724184 [Mycena haematopus]|nr:hypothetical protein B0H12DRAFT_724184 [Mycena haematopus]
MAFRSTQGYTFQNTIYIVQGGTGIVAWLLVTKTTPCSRNRWRNHFLNRKVQEGTKKASAMIFKGESSSHVSMSSLSFPRHKR